MAKKAMSEKRDTIYGWQVALVSCGLLLMDLILGGLIGALFSITSTISLLLAIVTGIVNLSKGRRSNNPSLTIAMSIIASIVYCLLLAAIGGSGRA